MSFFTCSLLQSLGRQTQKLIVLDIVCISAECFIPIPTIPTAVLMNSENMYLFHLTHETTPVIIKEPPIA